MEIIQYIGILMPTLALCMALYTFLSNHPKFREFSIDFGRCVFINLAAGVCCAAMLLAVNLNLAVSNLILKYTKLAFATIYAIGWVYLTVIFYQIYGSLYHMKTKAFLKHTWMFKWFYNVCQKKHYEINHEERKAEAVFFPRYNTKRWDNIDSFRRLFSCG